MREGSQRDGKDVSEGITGQQEKASERTTQVKVRKALILVGPCGVPGGLGTCRVPPSVGE